jgi:ribosomal protein S18 acetylase RimI-like enzyme
MASSSVRVRRASTKDYRSAARVQLRAVLDGYRHIFPPELPRPTAAALEAEWEIILRRDDLVVLVAAISRNEVIGTIVVSIDGSMGRVSRLHVDPAFWSRGAGQSLLQSAVEYLRAQGCKSAVLWVLRENHRARHLYDHLGWRADRHVTKSGPHDPRDSVLTPVAGRLISGDQPQGSPPIRAQRKTLADRTGGCLTCGTTWAPTRPTCRRRVRAVIAPYISPDTARLEVRSLVSLCASTASASDLSRRRERGSSPIASTFV